MSYLSKSREDNNKKVKISVVSWANFSLLNFFFLIISIKVFIDNNLFVFSIIIQYCLLICLKYCTIIVNLLDYLI